MGAGADDARARETRRRSGRGASSRASSGGQEADVNGGVGVDNEQRVMNFGDAPWLKGAREFVRRRWRGVGGADGEAALVTLTKKYGLDGLAAYGLLNTLYYVTAILIVGAHQTFTKKASVVALPSLRSAVELAAMVWAGSQITKGFRIGGAVVLAPAAGRVLDAIQNRLRLKSRELSLALLSAVCITFAAVAFSSSLTIYRILHAAALVRK